jgi:hypothetical protein
VFSAEELPASLESSSKIASTTDSTNQTIDQTTTSGSIDGRFSLTVSASACRREGLPPRSTCSTISSNSEYDTASSSACRKMTPNARANSSRASSAGLKKRIQTVSNAIHTHVAGNGTTSRGYRPKTRNALPTSSTPVLTPPSTMFAVFFDRTRKYCVGSIGARCPSRVPVDRWFLVLSHTERGRPGQRRHTSVGRETSKRQLGDAETGTDWMK